MGQEEGSFFVNFPSSVEDGRYDPVPEEGDKFFQAGRALWRGTQPWETSSATSAFSFLSIKVFLSGFSLCPCEPLLTSQIRPSTHSAFSCFHLVDKTIGREVCGIMPMQHPAPSINHIRTKTGNVHDFLTISNLHRFPH